MNHAKLEQLAPEIVGVLNAEGWRGHAIQLEEAIAEQPEGKVVPVDERIIEFLCGAAPHPETGLWFGERIGKAQYWWRESLRSAAAPNNAAATPKELGNAHESKPDTSTPAAAPERRKGQRQRRLSPGENNHMHRRLGVDDRRHKIVIDAALAAEGEKRG